MQVLHDVVAAVQPSQNADGNGAEAGINGAGHERDLSSEPSTLPLRVAVDHKRMANADQESESAKSGASHSCMR